jgi:hypothetical protein
MARNTAPDIEFFAEIHKVDEEQRTVFGYASTDCRDRQGEIVTRDAIAKALPDYMLWKNVREMHQPSAVGRAIEANMDEKGLYFGAYVADDRAWKKVKDKVYKGFSIGGRVLARDPNDKTIVTGVMITEISLVDRPANPEAKFDWFKRADDHLAFTPTQYWGCGCKDHQHIAKAEAQECMADQAADLKKRLDDGGLLKFNQNHAPAGGPDGGQFTDDKGGDGDSIKNQYGGRRPKANAETGKNAGKFQLKLASGRAPKAGPIAGKEGPHNVDHFVDQYGNLHRAGKDGKMHEVQKLDEVREILKAAFDEAEAMSKIDSDGFDTETGEFMGKREFSQKERQQDAKAGIAMPGGGYPIKDTEDLHNAIQAFGRAKDPAATKAHIKQRAKALGAEDQLPKEWTSGGADDDVNKAMTPPRHIETSRFAGHFKSKAEAETLAKQHGEAADKATKLHNKHMKLSEESAKAGNPAGAAAHRAIASSHRTMAARHSMLSNKYSKLAESHGKWAAPEGNDAVSVAKRALAEKLAKLAA